MMFLTTQSLWLAAFVLVGVTTAIAMASPVLVRRAFGLDKLSANNEVAGFKFATVGVLYAVLLGFAIIVVWEKFSDAESGVAQEAGAAATVYRLAAGIGDAPGDGGPGTALRERLNTYVETVIHEDWPAMERGGASPAATRALDATYAAALSYSPNDRRGEAVLTEVLRQLDAMTQARRARLVLAAGIVPEIIWIVLFVGAVLVIGFTLFFGAENLFAQTLMTGVLTVLIFSGLLIIVAIDHPFAGSVKVTHEALSTVLENFGGLSQP